MDSLFIILLVVLIGISLVILYFQLTAKPKQEENVSDKIKPEQRKKSGRRNIMDEWADRAGGGW